MYTNRHECWELFWKEQLTVEDELDVEQMKQELFEYKTLLDQMNQLQHASAQPHILVQLAIEQRIQKHQQKVVALFSPVHIRNEVEKWYVVSLIKNLKTCLKRTGNRFLF
jgi:hypothetical protein